MKGRVKKTVLVFCDSALVFFGPMAVYLHDITDTEEFLREARYRMAESDHPARLPASAYRVEVAEQPVLRIGGRLEENLEAIAQHLGMAIITERDGSPGWCISDGGTSEVCGPTLVVAAAWFAMQLDALAANVPLEYQQRSE